MLSLKLNLFQIDFKFVFCQHLHFEIQILLGIGYQNDFIRIEGYIILMTLFFSKIKFWPLKTDWKLCWCQVWNKLDFLKSGFFTLLLFSGIARGIAVDEDTLIGDTIQYRKNYASRRLSRSVLHVLARTMDTEIQPPNHIGYCKVAILSYAVSPNFTPKSHKNLVMMLIDHETVGSVGTQHISTPVDFYLPSIKYLPLHFQMKEI